MSQEILHKVSKWENHKAVPINRIRTWVRKQQRFAAGAKASIGKKKYRKRDRRFGCEQQNLTTIKKRKDIKEDINGDIQKDIVQKTIQTES